MTIVPEEIIQKALVHYFFHACKSRHWDIKKAFNEFGQIESIRFRSIPVADPKLSRRVIFITKNFHENRDSMNAYVVFKSKESAEKALAFNGKTIGEKHIRVDLAGSKKENTRLSVFVGNLPLDVEEEQLSEHFSECGKIDYVRAVRDKNSNIGKGFAFVCFRTEESVVSALNLNGTKFKNRDLRVTRALDLQRVNRNNKPKRKNTSYNKYAYQRRKKVDSIEKTNEKNPITKKDVAAISEIQKEIESEKMKKKLKKVKTPEVIQKQKEKKQKKNKNKKQKKDQ